MVVHVDEVAGKSLFSGFTRGELEQILAMGKEEHFARGDVIIEESVASTDLFVLLSGAVSVEIQMVRAGGKRVQEQIVRLRAPDVFGEIAFLEGKRRSASVVALDNIRVLRLDGPSVKDLFKARPRMGYVAMSNLCLILSHRLIDSNFRWRNEKYGG
ncbi:MAG: cyclic nucleotide-binding domain-containing protein [Deltaproteobacteria bacterium]|nr:cyclic nucleotide-binding domain-containing protein [Deltaproteobacteria bacterium]